MTSSDVQYILDIVGSLIDAKLADFGRDQTREREGFRKEMQTVLNRYSRENASNTPDFILAHYLESCLNAFDCAVQQRETWYGREPRPTAGKLPDPNDTRQTESIT